MRRPRLLIAACCLGLCLIALAVPALALAGGSAGDQQYTDPFGGSNSGGSTTTAQATTTTRSVVNPPPAPTQAAPAATAPAPIATADPTPDPTATIAQPDPRTLPYTGYADWTAAGFGAVLLGAGLTLRLRTRSAR